MKSKSLREYLKEAYFLYTKKENFLVFGKIAGTLTGLYFLLNFNLSYLISTRYAFLRTGEVASTPLYIEVFLVFLAFMVIMLWIRSVILAVVVNVGRRVSEVNFYKLGWSLLPKFILLSIVLGLLISLGTIAFIIPGILVATWLTFSQYFLFDKGEKVFASFKKSKELFKGRFFNLFWKLLAIWLLVGIIKFIFGYIPYVGVFISFFLEPLFMLPVFLIYKDLVRN